MEELLPALPHDRRRGKAQRRDCQFWGIRTPLSASWVVDGNRRRRGRVIEIISVVLQFNDLWLRRGWSQRNVRRFTRIFGKLSGGNVGATIYNLRDLIPEVVETSTCTSKSRTRSARIGK